MQWEKCSWYDNTPRNHLDEKPAFSASEHSNQSGESITLSLGQARTCKTSIAEESVDCSGKYDRLMGKPKPKFFFRDS